MAIVQTVLGPNSSVFTTTGTAETAATMMAAISAYVVTKGWTVFDAEAPLTNLTVGQVFRAPHASSDTTLKYINISLSNANGQLVPYENWNAATHVGTNPYNYVNQGGSSPTQHTFSAMAPSGFSLALEDTSVIVFAHPRWLAMRMRSNQLSYGQMHGAFEISKDYGEPPNLIANAFLSNAPGASYPSGNGNNGFFGVPAVYSTPGLTTAQNATSYTNVLTAIGLPATGYTLSNITGGQVQNFALTMMAVESTSTAATVKSVRGRVFGAKLLGGQQVWNDMDTVAVAVDANYFQTTEGTPALHHVIVFGLKLLIPA